MHFEQLWESGEKFNQESSKEDLISSILDELILKINLYKVIDSKEIPEEEKSKIKSHTMGEILLTLTNLSLKDNINVFDSLNLVLHLRNLE